MVEGKQVWGTLLYVASLNLFRIWLRRKGRRIKWLEHAGLHQGKKRNRKKKTVGKATYTHKEHPSIPQKRFLCQHYNSDSTSNKKKEGVVWVYAVHTCIACTRRCEIETKVRG